MKGDRPIHIDPAIQEIMMLTGPSLEDIAGHIPDRKVEWSSSLHHPETLGELIEVLQDLEEQVGPDAELRDWETGTSKTVSARRYDTGETEVEL